MKFRDHKYTWTHPYSSTTHQWSFRGPLGGLSLQISLMDDEASFPHPSCGLEFHRNTQPHGEPRAADNSPCWLTGQPCWHDGISLYASEIVWPHVRLLLEKGSHKEIFRYLKHIYEDHFEETSND